MAQLTPEDRVRLETFKAVTVKHAHLQEADDQLSLWVEEHTDATHVLLCGPGGVGKSKILHVVAERFKDEESDIDVIEVTLAQMEKAGVSRFECPMCLAVRDIQPKGGRVKFTSHPKRTTNTPNHGLRWVKRGSAWEISD